MAAAYAARVATCGVLDVSVEVAMAGTSSIVLDKIMLVRMPRLARLVRAARLVVQFRTLWLLVQGLWHSIMPMLWTFIIMAAVVYIFAVLGIELIREAPEYGEAYDVAQVSFQNLQGAMLTLIQFMTLDSIASTYKPLILSRPELAIFLIFL